MSKMMLFYAECGCLRDAILDVDALRLQSSYDAAMLEESLRECHHAVVEQRETVGASPCPAHTSPSVIREASKA